MLRSLPVLYVVRAIEPAVALFCLLLPSMPSLLPFLLPFAGLCYHSAFDVPFVTHIVIVRRSMYSYIGKGREGFLRDRLVCLSYVSWYDVYMAYSTWYPTDWFLRIIFGKKRRHGTARNKNSIDFSCKQCFFLSFLGSFFLLRAENDFKVHIVVEIRLACCRCCLNFVHRQPKRFVTSLKWNETNVAIVTGCVDSTPTPTNLCYAWFCSRNLSSTLQR